MHDLFCIYLNMHACQQHNISIVRTPQQFDLMRTNLEEKMNEPVFMQTYIFMNTRACIVAGSFNIILGWRKSSWFFKMNYDLVFFFLSNKHVPKGLLGFLLTYILKSEFHKKKALCLQSEDIQWKLELVPRCKTKLQSICAKMVARQARTSSFLPAVPNWHHKVLRERERERG